MTEWTGAIATTAESWLQEHPLLAWLIHHPLLSFGLAAVGLLLLWSLFQAFIEITQEFWVRLLNVPLHLGRWMLQGLYRAILTSVHLTGFAMPLRAHLSSGKSPHRPVAHPAMNAPVIDASVGESADADIVNLLYRLEQLTKEQHQIFHQLALLAEARHQAPTSQSPVASK